ncbi:MAG: recombination protein RecR [Clostridia bacterium]|nr:recombination protein RecR [Clostridia bacterium]MBT7123348.1 recombination protein RecR [Clostridia bacterium]
MSHIIEPVLRLINQFSKLPGIGYKTAQRLAFHVINMSDEEVEEFAKDMFYAKKKAVYCDICGNMMQKGDSACVICCDDNRDFSTVCVVSDVKDVLAIEKTREYKGVYHVLHGVISPMDGVGPDDINIAGLLDRLAKGDIAEVILATNPDVQGTATAAYIAKTIRPLCEKVTRIAHGVPIGGDLEYTDEVTLMRAIEGRTEY